MLTLKKVAPDGFEHIAEVETAMLERQENEHPLKDLRRYSWVVTGELETGAVFMHTDGLIYVMNRDGKTIGSYNLDKLNA